MHVRHAILAVAAALSAAAAAAEPTTVSVGVCEMPGIFEFEGGEPTGAIADVWADIASRAGIQSRFVPERNIAALIADTAAGRIDVLLGPLAMTEARERQVDFTHPVMMSGMRIAVPGGPDRPWLAPLLSLVSREMLTVVLAIIALVIVTAHVLWFVERIRNPQAFPAGYREGVWEAIWWSISTIVTGGCEDKPIETTAGRAVAIVWMLGGITVVATLT
ncbi:MAG: transporter substrate-binding domain-containing protein, partial [Planctomycetes bacterium]|nr:transporter substrate-binding domain-containing protein [Planctomycetota bacterium]